MGAAAAGWYDDPTGVFQTRYWDGTSWSDQVMSHGVRVTARPDMDPAQAQSLADRLAGPSAASQNPGTHGDSPEPPATSVPPAAGGGAGRSRKPSKIDLPVLIIASGVAGIVVLLSWLWPLGTNSPANQTTTADSTPSEPDSTPSEPDPTPAEPEFDIRAYADGVVADIERSNPTVGMNVTYRGVEYPHGGGSMNKLIAIFRAAVGDQVRECEILRVTQPGTIAYDNILYIVGDEHYLADDVIFLMMEHHRC